MLRYLGPLDSPRWRRGLLLVLAISATVPAFVGVAAIRQDPDRISIPDLAFALPTMALVLLGIGIVALRFHPSLRDDWSKHKLTWEPYGRKPLTSAQLIGLAIISLTVGILVRVAIEVVTGKSVLGAIAISVVVFFILRYIVGRDRQPSGEGTRINDAP